MSSGTTHCRRSVLPWLVAMLLAPLAGLSTASAAPRDETFRWEHPDASALSAFCIYALDTPSNRVEGFCSNVGLPSADAEGVFSATLEGLDDEQTWFCVSAIGNDADRIESDCSNWLERPPIVQDTESPCGSHERERWCADFDDLNPGEPAPGWLNTGARNSMFIDDSLFLVHDLVADQVSERLLSTLSTASNIHSHYALSLDNSWSDYDLRGRMRMTDEGTGIGVTVYSQYNREDAYYRLRRTAREPDFHLSMHPNDREESLDCSRQSTGVEPEVDVWYEFRFEVENADGETQLRASVWRAGEPEPASWQAECTDASEERLGNGTVGLWSDAAGVKYWDDLRVLDLLPRPPEPLGQPGQPELLSPGS